MTVSTKSYVICSIVARARAYSSVSTPPRSKGKAGVYQFEDAALLRQMDQMPDYSEMPFAANKARPSREAR